MSVFSKFHLFKKHFLSVLLALRRTLSSPVVGDLPLCSEHPEQSLTVPPVPDLQLHGDAAATSRRRHCNTNRSTNRFEFSTNMAKPVELNRSVLAPPVCWPSSVLAVLICSYITTDPLVWLRPPPRPSTSSAHHSTTPLAPPPQI